MQCRFHNNNNKNYVYMYIHYKRTNLFTQQHLKIRNKITKDLPTIPHVREEIRRYCLPICGSKKRRQKVHNPIFSVANHLLTHGIILHIASTLSQRLPCPAGLLHSTSLPYSHSSLAWIPQFPQLRTFFCQLPFPSIITAPCPSGSYDEISNPKNKYSETCYVGINCTGIVL